MNGAEGAAAEVHSHPEPATEILPTATGTLLTNASLIDIGGGATAPLGELLEARSRRCPHCSEGWVRRPQKDGTVISAICGCCVEGYRKAKARAARERTPTPAGVPVVHLRELERARQRTERLTREVGALEAERAERVRRFDENNAELIASAKAAAASAQDEASLALRAEAEVAHLAAGVADAEKQLSLLKPRLAGEEEALVAHREARVLALSMQADAEREVERRRGMLNLARLDKDLAKVRRRLYGEQIRNGAAGDAPAPGAA